MSEILRPGDRVIQVAGAERRGLLHARSAASIVVPGERAALERRARQLAWGGNAWLAGERALDLQVFK